MPSSLRSLPSSSSSSPPLPSLSRTSNFSTSPSQPTNRASRHRKKLLYTNIKGNIVVHAASLSDSLHYFNIAHRKASRHCVGHPCFPACYERHRGLATSVRICCKLCSFESQNYEKLYEEIASDQRGVKMAKMNIQIAIFSFKSSLAFSDISLLFAALDCNFLHEGSYRRLVSRIAPLIEQAGKDAISKNRDIVKQIAAHNPSLQGSNGLALVPCQTDTLYNNPNHGRSYSSPGTQSVTPTMEGITHKKLIVSLTAINQLCSKNHNDCSHQNCGLNYSPQETIDSSERSASVANYNELINDGLQVQRLCHDGITGSSHLAGMRDAAQLLGIKPPDSSPCTIHLKRSGTRQMFKIKLSELALAGCPKELISKYNNSISHAIATRCAWEVIFAFLKYQNQPKSL